MSPPLGLKYLNNALDMRPHWFSHHVAYTISKYSMSMVVLGLSGEFEEYGISVNALWVFSFKYKPLTAIETSAVSNVITGKKLFILMVLLIT